MSNREEQATNFIRSTAWKDARITKVAGDASNRTYDRLSDPASGKTAIFMNAPPEKGEDVAPFIKIARHLRKLGLHAPEILESDRQNGFLVLEDLGDDLFSHVLEQQPTLEHPLYAAATEVLLHLHRADLPDVETYDAPLMTELALLAFTKYAGSVCGADDSAQSEFADVFGTALGNHTADDPVLILRDYHADNLLWLPDNQGVARVGLLDFQDAMKGHRAYDLASMLQDVRRNVAEDVETEMIARYVAKSGVDGDAFRIAYSLLGAQRALRILGVFARLGLEYGRPHYVDMIPKVWSVLMHNLDQPALESVASLIKTALPEPTADVLARLKSS